MEIINKFGKLLTVVAGFAVSASVTYGFWLSLQIVNVKLGLFAAIVSFFIAPITILAVPLWSGFVESYWTPAIYVFTPVLILTVIFVIVIISIYILKKMGLKN